MANMTECSDKPLTRTILVTRHDKIGDFVLTLPLCKAIKEGHPDIRLGVLVSEANYEFANALEFIDYVILYGRSFSNTVRAIRKIKPDLSISCYIDNRLGALLLAAKVPRRIAPATKLAQMFFNQTIVQRRSKVEKTEWQYNMDLGLAAYPTDTLHFAPPLLTFPKSSTQSNRVIFHPGSGGSSEGNLKLTDYLNLARLAASIKNVEVAFTFGPSDQFLLDQVKHTLDFPAILISNPMSLVDFSKFISESRLFVSTSTGPMHLAGAVNTPTLSFFGTSLFASDRRWAPISDPKHQSNFLVRPDYEPSLVDRIAIHMVSLLTRTDLERGSA